MTSAGRSSIRLNDRNEGGEIALRELESPFFSHFKVRKVVIAKALRAKNDQKTLPGPIGQFVLNPLRWVDSRPFVADRPAKLAKSVSVNAVSLTGPYTGVRKLTNGQTARLGGGSARQDEYKTRCRGSGVLPGVLSVHDQAI